MKEIDTITFQGDDSSDEAVAVVRYDGDVVALCLSCKSNGDVAVAMTKTEAARLVEALNKAIKAN